MTPEDILQISCIKWFRYQYPGLRKMLFAVPNGGKRESRINQYGNRYSPEAQKLERMGVIAGVSDLILLTPRHGFGALCIEMKVGKGRQSLAQQEWELEAISAGNKYVICRSVDEFMNEVNQYLAP